MAAVTKRTYTGAVGLAVAAVLGLGAGAAVAQEYPVTPVEEDGVDVLPSVEQRPDGAPDAAAVQADTLSATGFDTTEWALAGLGAVALGGAALVATRRRGSQAS